LQSTRPHAISDKRIGFCGGAAGVARCHGLAFTFFRRGALSRQRSTGASTAAISSGKSPNLASALLNHRDPRVTDEHYNRSMGIGAGEEYALIAQLYREHS
jgi:hypothetical protein